MKINSVSSASTSENPPNSTRVLWLGWGRLGRLAQPALESSFELISVSRSPAERDKHLCMDLADSGAYQRLMSLQADVIVLTLSPDQRSVEAYQRSYVRPLQLLLAALQKTKQRPFILCISSSSLWGQAQSGLIDEQTEARPDRATAQQLLSMEQALRASKLAHCIVRFAGIYGDGRFHLIKQLVAGKPGPARWTNRIHERDCAQVIAFLLERWRRALPVPELVIGCDSEPCLSTDIQGFIAEALALPWQPAAAESESLNERRLSNRLLLSLGYQFIYPGYRQAYPTIIEQYRQLNSDRDRD
ncbi:hypothetical protein [Agaribacterium haliotis]|uniref:hypothetical protein n=1 Tax=Agaribacterium haliotis TaxID=2013869 RepID=UPI000BB59FB3|nr:hypothetical protein [Agaribacterium haliotis]